MINPFTMGAKLGIGENLKTKSDITLSAILIVIALVILFVALLPGHPIFKALFIAWIVLP